MHGSGISLAPIERAHLNFDRTRSEVDNTAGNEGSRWQKSDLFQGTLCKQIKHAEQESKKLREQQKHVKLMYEPAKEQMAMFETLRKLLECKQHCLLNDGSDAPGGMD